MDLGVPRSSRGGGTSEIDSLDHGTQGLSVRLRDYSSGRSASGSSARLVIFAAAVAELSRDGSAAGSARSPSKSLARAGQASLAIESR